MNRTIHHLYRYPIKGLSPEPLPRVALQAGQGFPHDRAFAITNGGWAYDAATYTPRPKMDFLMLMLHERLALLKTRVDEARGTVQLQSPDGPLLQARLDDAASLSALEDFLAGYLGDKLKGRPQFVRSETHRFTDVSVVSPQLMRSISLINLASVRALGERMGVALDPLRFRANVYFDGGAPWEELGWLDRECRLGGARVRVVMKTRRCAATNVDPATGVRDLGVPQALMKHFKHMDLGVYAEVLEDGVLQPGDRLQPVA